MCRLLGAQFEENPAPQPTHFPRPNETFLPREEQEVAAEEQVGNADDLNAFFDS